MNILHNREVDIIAAEDTRHTSKLLHHFNILGKTVLSYYTHNSYKQIEKLIELAKEGNKIALVSDAGYKAFILLPLLFLSYLD